MYASWTSAVAWSVCPGDVRINGVLVTVDSSTRKAERIERIRVNADGEETTRYDSDDGKPELCDS